MAFLQNSTLDVNVVQQLPKVASEAGITVNVQICNLPEEQGAQSYRKKVSPSHASYMQQEHIGEKVLIIAHEQRHQKGANVIRRQLKV